MAQIPDSAGQEPVLKRIHRTMLVSTALAVLISAFIGSWQFTIGLAIGGLLALLNHRWLQSSISAAFGVLVNGETPRITIGNYVFRYAVVGGLAFAAYEFGIASLAAIMIGLCTFVVALLVEAFREFYIAIIRREETG